MQHKHTRRGFTLIELLVVVLIIGILAAVAVPQYQKAVIKSRIAAFLPLVASMVSAEESYYLANGQYTSDARILDLDIPAICNMVENTDGQYWKCDQYFLVDFSKVNQEIVLSYCPNYNINFATCRSQRDLSIAFRYSNTTTDGNIPNSRLCFVQNSSALGNAICKTLFS